MRRRRPGGQCGQHGSTHTRPSGTWCLTPAGSWSSFCSWALALDCTAAEKNRHGGKPKGQHGRRMDSPVGESIFHTLSPPMDFTSPICTAGWRCIHCATVHPAMQNAFTCPFGCRVGLSLRILFSGCRIRSVLNHFNQRSFRLQQQFLDLDFYARIARCQYVLMQG
jgi:hypothetical protein